MSERYTDAELAELRELEGAATKGPWRVDPYSEGADGEMGRLAWVVGGDERPIFHLYAPDDARFIARSREAVPRLLDEVEELREIAARVTDEMVDTMEGTTYTAGLDQRIGKILRALREVHDASE